ncbi:hypothetical protein, partial [Actinomadura sp. 3N508]|uniref:hypothetical protein n=1 Tax=Actinomadura sp. 3N508 TaxID=3375153 RepID=UPI003797C9C0
ATAFLSFVLDHPSRRIYAVAVSRHDATLFTCGNSYTTSVDATKSPQSIDDRPSKPRLAHDARPTWRQQFAVGREAAGRTVAGKGSTGAGKFGP